MEQNRLTVSDDDGLNTPAYQSLDLSNKETERWDIFKLPPQRIKSQRDESLLFVVPLKILRFLCFVVTFSVVIGSSIFSKLTLTLMSSQTIANRTMDLDVETTNKRFIVSTNAYERMAWSWCLLFTLLVPEVFTFLDCLWTVIFKSNSKTLELEKNLTIGLLPMRKTVIQNDSSAVWMVFFAETCHIIGICMLVFVVIPHLDSIKAMMLMNGLFVVPCLLLIASRIPSEKPSPKPSGNDKYMFYLKLGMDMVSFMLLFGGLIAWTYANQDYYLMIVAILISCGWWENYINEDRTDFIMEKLKNIRNTLKYKNKRYFVYLYISIWKIIVCFTVFFIYLAITMEVSLLDLLPEFKLGFTDQPVQLIQTWQTSRSAVQGAQGDVLQSTGMLPLYVMLINIGCGILCYMFSVFACKICIQEFSFSFSLSISIPISIFLMSSACSWRMEDHAFLTNIFPKYIYWSCPKGDFISEFLMDELGWIWVCWFISQAWVTAHIWSPLFIRRAATDRLFVSPMYCGAIIDQSLLLNRRRHKQVGLTFRDKKTEAGLNNGENDGGEGQNNSGEPEGPYDISGSKKKDRSDTKVYACATMWHEDKDEMVEMLKSIMRVDKYLAFEDERSAYEFDVHIFFDDAFTMDESDKDKKLKKRKMKKPASKEAGKDEKPQKVLVLNKYVNDLVSVMNKAASKIYSTNIREIGLPTRIITPYGGRLLFTLPGQTGITIHLKDKNKIRHKKRWSQVMYMYYLLGYLFMDESNDEKRDQIEDKIFILALDGDIDFKASAINRLLDLMDDPTLGAACGRIHPVGTGPIVWYQKFEYAIGHWLQKATEHVTGCVLCSPGCFSLFRGKAIMEVMRTYATVAEKALHYVQYDQGEDRWLCTLILKRGYRIEYSAASDAYTHAPESFKDFYVQRRRWGPSTMANVMDLLMDYKETVKINNSISTLYIIYQGMMMAGTILGPGTIFLMVVGAMVAAFRISNYISLASNLIPLIVFILICFFASDQIQIMFAMILSSAYALLMTAVLIGTAIQLNEDGISSPSGIFLIALSSSFIISAILHPQEFFCVVHGFLYFLMVPSMYLLLNIYSLINLWNVSWGTREDPNKKAEEEELKKAEQIEEKKKAGALNNVSEWLGLEDKESFLSKFCQCFFCTYQKDDKAAEQLLLKNNENLTEITKMINLIDLKTDAYVDSHAKLTSSGKRVFEASSKKSESSNETIQKPKVQISVPEKKIPTTLKKENNTEDYLNPLWAQQEPYKKYPKEILDEKETHFWKEMIKKYLLPLDKDVASEKKATAELLELRNKVVFAFFMINGLFILIVFLLQLNKETLYLNWPVNAKCNITFIPDSNRVQVDWDYLQLEPFGLVFAIFFGAILFLQFVGMLAHRFGTFSHIMADTTLSCKLEKSVEFADDDVSGKEDAEEDDIEEDCSDETSPVDNRQSISLSPISQRASFAKGKSIHQRLLSKQMQSNPGDRRVSVFMLEEHKNKDQPKFDTLQEMIEARRQKSFRRESLAAGSTKSTKSSSFKALEWRRKSKITENILKTSVENETLPPNGSVRRSPNRESMGFDNIGFFPEENQEDLVNL